MDLLTVEHLTKTYGTGENAVHALDDVSFSVPRGQFLAIIGPSGSGRIRSISAPPIPLSCLLSYPNGIKFARPHSHSI